MDDLKPNNMNTSMYEWVGEMRSSYLMYHIYCHLTDTTECINANPCQNGAACVVQGGNYLCDCPDGYEGMYCSEGKPI